MSLKFLNLKSFHPGNKSNQKLLYLAEEESKSRLKEEERAVKEFNDEQESFKEKLQREEEKKRTQQNRENFRKMKEKQKAEEESLALNPDFKGTKKKRRPKKQKQEQSRPLSFLYVLPPGLKNVMEKEEKERILKEAAVIPPTEPQKPEEKFPLLKNAPSEGSFVQTKDVKLTYKPFGKEIRDVKCTKCGGFGHTSIDKECPLKNYNPLDEKRQEMEDPMKQVENLENKIEIKQNVLGFDPKDLILDEEKSERKKEKKLLKKLEKEKRKLEKKLKRQREKEEETSNKEFKIDFNLEQEETKKNE